MAVVSVRVWFPDQLIVLVYVDIHGETLEMGDRDRATTMFLNSDRTFGCQPPSLQPECDGGTTGKSKSFPRFREGI